MEGGGAVDLLESIRRGLARVPIHDDEAALEVMAERIRGEILSDLARDPAMKTLYDVLVENPQRREARE